MEYSKQSIKMSLSVAYTLMQGTGHATKLLVTVSMNPALDFVSPLLFVFESVFEKGQYSTFWKAPIQRICKHVCRLVFFLYGRVSMQCRRL